MTKMWAIFAAATLVASVEARLSPEQAAVAQEMSAAGRKLQDLTSAAMMCVAAEPCATASCISAASVAMSPVCSAVLGAPDSIGPDMSDGDSMGVLALMLDGPMDNTLAAGVCTSFKNDEFGSTCVLPLPLEAFLTTMMDNADGACADLNTVVGGMIAPDTNSTEEEGAEEEEEEVETTPHTPTTATAAQIAVVDATFASVINATELGSLGDAGEVAAAMADLGLSWTDFVGESLGFTSTTAVAELSGTCFATAAATFGITASDWAYTYAASLLASAQSEEAVEQAIAGSPLAVEAMGVYTAMLNSTDDFPAVFIDKFLAVLSGSEAYTLETLQGEMETIIGEHCASDTTCVDAATTAVTAKLTSMAADFGTAMASVPGVQFIASLETLMTSCMGLTGAAGPYIAALQALSSGTATADQMGFVNVAILATGCQLYATGNAEGADPQFASKTGCYQYSLFAGNAAFATSLMTGGPSLENLFSLDSSLTTMDTRCTAAGVSLTGEDDVVDDPVATSAPTEQELSAAGTVIPHMMVLAVSLVALLL